MQPSQFYTGLVAELYKPLRSASPDPDLYAGFIGLSGEPALELGCGDGDPLLDLRSRGLDVEGVDSSADMVRRCRDAAATFNLLTTDEDASAALQGIRAHLEPGGSALIPLFIPAPTPPEDLGRAKEASEPNGALIRVTPVSERRDEHERTQETVLRYERIIGDAHAVEERCWTVHWHTQEGFRSLAAAAGLHAAAVLDEHGEPAPADAETFAFWLQPAG